MERGTLNGESAEGSEIVFLATPEDAGERLDRALARRTQDMPGLSRSLLQGWIEEGRARVNGREVRKPALRLNLNDAVAIGFPRARAPRREPQPEEMALAVVYEDEHFLAVDKPPGLVVHPTPRRAGGTLLNGLLHLANAWGEGARPGLVSRLDRDTSGLLLVSKRPEIHGALAHALKGPAARKDYLTVAYGPVPLAKGRIDRPLRRDPADPRRRVAAEDGLPSSTLYERLAETAAADLVLLRCTLLTGRTHQIRIHLASQGWPIVGDPVYGEPRWSRLADPALAAACRDFPRQALHAWRLALEHPVAGEPLALEAPPPADLAGLLGIAGFGPAG